jgi:anti-anti-sigma factor
MKTQDMHFTFADTIGGYVRNFDWDKEIFQIETSDGRIFNSKLTATTYAEMVRNLNEPYIDCSAKLKDMLQEERFLYAHGIFFPENGELKFEAKHILFLGNEVGEYRFEKQDWWIKQVKQLGDFYLNAQFGDSSIDFKNYRTNLSLEGDQTGNYRQETDTISRLVYGLASAYMMTGEDRYLEAAEKGTKYLRDHMRSVDTTDDIAFWYHGIDIKGNHERKIFASEFGDDYDAIPAYEQIYALAGPTQTYRITGDKKIIEDIDLTLNLFDKYFLDKKLGGYFSHIDPISFDPRSESLTRDRARKNWNSVGDHAPAFLINAYLATESPRYKDMLKYTADTITEHFQDYQNSPFVQEKFHEDWSKDQTWGWQQNRAVVGHNLKIAWNLTRINSLHPNKKYMDFANKIAKLMPKSGMDAQRGGWYDVVERTLGDNEEFHRFAWHDRKAWWQQEQGILAYLIMAGTENNEDYLKLARESAAFYNSWFLDHDSGAVYFNVMANGLPYLLGTERLKGSHSMSGYHSFELAYLAAIYTNLLITKQHMDLYFKPYPNSFEENILRVAPDILPKGSVKIESVFINGEKYNEFDSEKLYVYLPKTNERVKVRVRVIPTTTFEHFTTSYESDKGLYLLKMKGDLDHRAIPMFRKTVSEIISQNPKCVNFLCDELKAITSEGIRSIIFEKQKMNLDTDLVFVNPNTKIKNLIKQNELFEEIKIASTKDE